MKLTALGAGGGRGALGTELVYGGRQARRSGEGGHDKTVESGLVFQSPYGLEESLIVEPDIAIICYLTSFEGALQLLNAIK